MRAIRLFIIILIATCAALARPAAQQARSIIFEGVTVVPMDSERVIAETTVLVSGNSIVRIGSGPSAPDGAVRVDGRGKFLMPALAEMHAHIPNNPAEAEGVLFLYVANGIGTI